MEISPAHYSPYVSRKFQVDRSELEGDRTGRRFYDQEQAYEKDERGRKAYMSEEEEESARLRPLAGLQGYVPQGAVVGSPRYPGEEGYKRRSVRRRSPRQQPRRTDYSDEEEY